MSHATPVMHDRQPVHQPPSGSSAARGGPSHNMLHSSLDNRGVNMVSNIKSIYKDIKKAKINSS